jgi:hypothetical protein
MSDTTTTTPATDLMEQVKTLRGASTPGRVEDGTRIHIHYTAFGVPTAKAVKAAQRAADLGLPRDRYTGRVSRVWTSKAGDTILTMWVELERDHQYRSFNLNKGTLHSLVVLGN